MERAENQMACFGGSECESDSFQVPQFTDQNYVRVFA